MAQSTFATSYQFSREITIQEIQGKPREYVKLWYSPPEPEILPHMTDTSGR